MRSRSDKPDKTNMYTLQLFNTLNIVDLWLIVSDRLTKLQKCIIDQ